MPAAWEGGALKADRRRLASPETGLLLWNARVENSRLRGSHCNRPSAGKRASGDPWLVVREQAVLIGAHAMKRQVFTKKIQGPSRFHAVTGHGGHGTRTVNTGFTGGRVRCRNV